MSVASAQSNPIERYFEISLYLLISTGFVTLAATGKLELPWHLFIVLALVGRGVLLVRDRTFTLPESWTNYLTLLYVAFFLVDFWFISANFVYAVVHLVLFITAVKMFSIHRGRDYFYLTTFPLFMVLGASLLTVDTVFFFAFFLFVMLATITLITMEMKRAAATAPVRARQLSEGGRRFAKALSWTAAALVSGIAVAGFVLFFILPRQTGGYLSSLAQSNQFVTGFSNEVELGRIGEIKQSSAVVMHVQIDGDRRGAYADLKWRGLALSMFDGRHWTRNPFSRIPLARTLNGAFDAVRIKTTHPSFNPSREGRVLAPLRYRVLMEPIGTDVFFVAPFAVSLSGRYRAVSGDAAGALFTSDESIGLYEAYSNLAEASPASLRATSGDIPPDIKIIYLQTPRMDARVARLAADIAANSSNAYDKTVAVEQYLKKNYGYTLTLPEKPEADPVGEFLFRRKEGHCEYFASAMAVMLRTLGIPSRMVTGFRGAEFNDLNSTYIVRASSAHTWVEAYFPGAGWASFDPTPPDPKPTITRWSRLALYIDAMGEFWREWIINYDFSHQLTLHNAVFSRSRVHMRDIEVTWKQGYQHLLERLRTARRRGDDRQGGMIAVLVMAVVLLLPIGNGLLRAWKKQRIALHPEQAPATAAGIWYQRMMRELARRGNRKRPGQTPFEFAASISEDSLRRSVANFTERYERARFGGSAEDAKQLPALYAHIANRD